MAGEGSIKLAEAPARFLAGNWTQLVSLKGGEANALAALDSRYRGFFDRFRRQRIEANPGTVASRQAEVDEQADLLADRLKEDFRSLGAKGRIIAYGFHAGQGSHQSIPAVLWATATMDFGAGTVEWKGSVWHHVTVELGATPGDVKSVAAKMRAWLDGRRLQHGDELKKTLRDAAREEFGPAFRVRAFNSAYAACYGRARGRPEKK